LILKVVVVGTGHIARETHLPIFKKLKQVEIAAVCDQQVSAAKDAAAQFGVKAVYQDLSEMLNKEKPDVVDICTPPVTHMDLAIQAMEAGCDVLVEKPMAMTTEEAERMVTSSKSNSVKLCVVHQNLYNTAVLKARQLVISGVLGDVLSVSVHTFEMRNSEALENKNHWSHSLLGGIFFEIIPHPVYLLLSFLKDARVHQVLSKKLGDREWVPKDELKVLVEGKNALGEVNVSCNSFMHGDTLDIVGTKTALTADLWGRTVLVYKPHTLSPKSVGMSNLHLSGQLFKVIGSTASVFLKAIRDPISVSAHYNFILKFIDGIQNGTEIPTTGEDGRDTVKMVEDICTQI
jgi:predicted dehydrogenase